MKKFTIKANEYLDKDTTAYFNYDYIAKNMDDDIYSVGSMIRILKNTFNKESVDNLNEAKKRIKDIMVGNIPTIIKENKLTSCVIIVIPRAKQKAEYFRNQLFFIVAVSEAARDINCIDGTNCIERIENTKTTHLRRNVGRETINGTIHKGENSNDGDMPYPGILRNTCKIDCKLIENKDIVLVDDIYTEGVNIDEDAIQTLYEYGAKKVIFYSIAKTKRFNI